MTNSKLSGASATRKKISLTVRGITPARSSSWIDGPSIVCVFPLDVCEGREREKKKKKKQVEGKIVFAMSARRVLLRQVCTKRRKKRLLILIQLT